MTDHSERLDIELSLADRAALYRRSFLYFAVAAFRVLFPGEEFLDNWHIDAIAYVLMEVHHGRRMFQLINMPPRTLKSFLVSVAYTAWLLGKDPRKKIIVVSYGQEIADRIANDTLRLISSQFYRDTFPDTRLSASKHSASEFETTAGGYRLATSVGGRITGWGGEIVILDDADKPADMDSEELRARTKDFFRSSALTRFNRPDHAKMVVVQQRLHEDDLSSMLIQDENWCHLNLPAIATEDVEIAIAQGEYKEFRRGELLHPAHLSEAFLARQRRSMLEHNYLSQYQQDPPPRGGSLNFWPLVTVSEPPTEPYDYIIQSWDPAVTDKEGNSSSACVTFGIIGRIAYVLDARRFSLQQPDLLLIMERMDRDWKPNAILVEVNGVGRGIHDMLRRQGFGHLIAVVAKTDKSKRLLGCEDVFRDKRFVVLKSIQQLEAYRREFSNFSSSRSNDLVDATTQFIAKMDQFLFDVRSRPEFIRARVEAHMAANRGKPYAGPQLEAKVTIIPLGSTDGAAEAYYEWADRHPFGW